jgi:hypothetical protein
MPTPDRVKKWDGANPERTRARKRAYKQRQRDRRNAVTAAMTQTTETTG